MSDSVDTVSLTDALATLHAALDEVQGFGLGSTTNDELLDAHRCFEQFRRRVESVEYRLIAEETQRRIPDEFCCRSTGQFLRHLLKIEPAEANARAAAAAAAGPRRTLTGQELPPVFEHVAAAQAAGTISQRHARVIEKTIDALPDEVAAVHGEQAERDLVNYAADFDPKHLSALAQRMSDCLDPDGRWKDPAEQQKRRSFSFTTRADGSSSGTFEATPEFTARMQAYLDNAARPNPATADGVKDSRSGGQRQHDALLALLKMAQRADDAASNNGVSMTVVVTMSEDDYLSGEGLARTSHGSLVPVSEVLNWSGGDAEVLAMAVNSMGAITHYGDTHRIFTEKQRRVIAIRDGGCSFPGCPEPPGRCQVDHVPRWEHGGTTRVDRGHLPCHYHHRNAEKHGWRPVIINGRPWWTPPKWIDPEQTPRRNVLHDTSPAV